MLGEFSYREVGCFSMDLTHTHTPMGDGTFEILYSQHVANNHVVDPNSPNYWSDCEYDVTPQVIEYDPWDLLFAQEYFIDTLLMKTYKYKDKLAKYQGKDLGSIKTLKKDAYKKD
jgi:hypothetical protein